ncbi:MAG: ABC transporter substrate-binding protein [Flavobacteriales bacterium]|nr:ABC transporter substrate-binding protein [Flavobacteriales bacterium]
MKLGILLPTSKLYPSLMIDFSAGVRMAITEFGQAENIEIIFESIHQGTDKNVVLNAVNKLVLQHQTDANILFTNFLLMEDIVSSLNALQTPLIITNIGGNAPLFFDHGEYIFSNSFGLWESAFKAAQWAVERFGPKTAYGSYFYEAGYGLYSAFCDGLSKSGGEVIFNQVSEFNPNPDDFSIFEKQMEIESPNFLYMLYSERDAVGFLNKLNASQMNGKYPIVTSGVLINDEILDKVEGSPKEIFNVSSWDLSDDSSMNLAFIKEFRSLNGKEANYFSLLGYECAGLICSAMKNEKWEMKGQSRADAIKNAEYIGPRGNLNFKNSNATIAQQNVYALNESMKRVKIAELGEMDARDEVLERLKLSANPSGWFQPYLCQ